MLTICLLKTKNMDMYYGPISNLDEGRRAWQRTISKNMEQAIYDMERGKREYYSKQDLLALKKLDSEISVLKTELDTKIKERLYLMRIQNSMENDL